MLEKMGRTKNNANAKVDAEVAPKVDAEVTPKVDAEVNTEISAEVDAEVYAKVAPKVNAEVDAGVAPKVSAEVDAEVVVVGGGLAGLSAAARLREHGVQVYYTAIFPSYICFIYAYIHYTVHFVTARNMQLVTTHKPSLAGVIWVA